MSPHVVFATRRLRHGVRETESTFPRRYFSVSAAGYAYDHPEASMKRIEVVIACKASSPVSNRRDVAEASSR